MKITRLTLLLLIILATLTITSGRRSSYSATLCVSPGGTGGCFSTIQAAITAASPGDIINVAAGTYTENVILNKSVTLNGAQTGVNACGRSAAESIIIPANPAVRTLELQTGSAGAVINGFTFSGGTRCIESTSGPINNLQILNNRIIGFTGSGVFLNDNGIDITVSRNFIDGVNKIGSGDLFHLDTDSFAGFRLLNNCIVGKGAADTSTGFFVDGNHNVGTSVTPRKPVISGNSISACQTGMNLGTRAFGSQTVANTGTISNNTFSNNLFDGLQGGIQNTRISGNVFSGNGRSGLALTSFGNTGTDRGAQNCTVTCNTMTGNGFTQNSGDTAGGGITFSATQAVGTISTNHANNNNISGNFAGARYSGTETIDAANNWWGSGTGPTSPSNPGGTGDRVVGANINFQPFRTSAVGDADGDNLLDACDTVLIVSPSNLQTWQQQHAHCLGGTSTGSQQFVNGPATPPLPVGSLQFTIGSDGDSFETIRYPGLDTVRLDQLTRLEYSTYVTNFNDGQAPYILLNIDFNGDTTLDDQLFFEPVYQSAAFFPSNPQAQVVEGQWQTWDALNGGWWSLNNVCGAGPGTNVKSLTQYLVCQPNARIINAAGPLGGFRIATGCGGAAWANFDGNIDNVSIAVNGAETTFNFEPDACTITCPNNVIQSNDKGQCGAVVSYPNPTPSGPGCGTITCSPASGSFFPKGTTTVNCSSTNGSTCSFTVTVNDTEAPMLTCPSNINSSTDPGTCSAVVNYQPPFVSDNCPCAPVEKKITGPKGEASCPATCNPASGSTFPVGTTTVTCMATDTSGNTGTCMFTVTVTDQQPPTITCPEDITRPTDPDKCSAVVTYATPPASDGCSCGGGKGKAPSGGGGGCPVTCSPASGSMFPKGTTTVTCTATDGSGNQASCTFRITVVDNQAPTISCPGTFTTVIGQGVCPPPGATLCFVSSNFPTASASDNCPGVIVTCVPPASTCFPVGTTTVTCTARDTSGNTAICGFSVVIFDGCLQDDSNPNTVLLFNTITGEYRFCCAGVTYIGQGKISRQGCIFTLEHNTVDRRVRGVLDKGVFRGNASVQSPPGRMRCNIADSNIRDNSCVCH